MAVSIVAWAMDGWPRARLQYNTDSQSNLCKHISAPHSRTGLGKKQNKTPLHKNLQQSFSFQDLALWRLDPNSQQQRSRWFPAIWCRWEEGCWWRPIVSTRAPWGWRRPAVWYPADPQSPATSTTSGLKGELLHSLRFTTAHASTLLLWDILRQPWKPASRCKRCQRRCSPPAGCSCCTCRGRTYWERDRRLSQLQKRICAPSTWKICLSIR